MIETTKGKHVTELIHANVELLDELEKMISIIREEVNPILTNSEPVETRNEVEKNINMSPLAAQLSEMNRRILLNIESLKEMKDRIDV